MAEEDADIVIGTDMPNQSGVFGIMPVRETGLQQGVYTILLLRVYLMYTLYTMYQVLYSGCI